VLTTLCARGIDNESDLEFVPGSNAAGWISGGAGCGDAACSRPNRAAGRVLVIDDFDADGATQHALVVRATARHAFAHVDFPGANHFASVYGLTPEIVALAAGRAPS